MDELGKMPWWVQASAVVGVPSLIAMYLTYVLATSVVGAVLAVSESVAVHADAQENVSKVLLNVAIQTCVNSAPSRDAADLCFVVGRGGTPRRVQEQ